jgi:hypothetical protein
MTMPDDEGLGFESIDFRSGRSWGWQDWGVVAAYALIGVATVLLTVERSPISIAAMVVGAVFLLVVIGADRRRKG